MITIRPYQAADHQAVAELVLTIQQQEFGIAVTYEDQPDLQNPQQFFKPTAQSNGNFWIALDETQIVGTIGLLDITNGTAILRKMFVQQDIAASKSHKNY